LLNAMRALPTRFAPGQVLAGKFRLERVLGAGGMGVVVAAEHMQLRQRVAIKLLHPEMLVRSDIVARFEREARATARLKNEHIARVLDVGVAETGEPYIVMEYLEGSDLWTLLRDERVLPVDTAIQYVLQACEALAEAHGVGIIHRDLKPQNLFLTRRVDGSPLLKVLDFGVSRFSDPGDVHLTRSSSIVGSPAYMSPEQLRAARNADERSDVWSLGVILYETLTRRLPFRGETMTDLFANVLSTPPIAPNVLRPEIAQGLSAAILRCLSVDPARRPSSVAVLALVLAPFGGAQASTLSERIVSITRATRPDVADASLAEASGKSVVRVATVPVRPAVEAGFAVAPVGGTPDAAVAAVPVGATRDFRTTESLGVEKPRRRLPIWLGLTLAGATSVGGLVSVGALLRGTGSSSMKAAPAPVTMSPLAPALSSAAVLGSVEAPPERPSAQEASSVAPTRDASAGVVVKGRPGRTPPATVGKPAQSAHPLPKDDPFQNRTSF
jgi:serine/threonine-protein kinase